LIGREGGREGSREGGRVLRGSVVDVGHHTDVKRKKGEGREDGREKGDNLKGKVFPGVCIL
jgi:hypothetical protein